MTTDSRNPQGAGSDNPGAANPSNPDAGTKPDDGMEHFAYPGEGDPSPATPAKPDSADPGKGGTTPPAGSDKGNEDQKPLLAGKYKDPAALEAGYQNLFSEHKKISDEAALARDENKALKAKLAQLEAGATPAGSTTDPNKSGTTPGKQPAQNPDKPWRNSPDWQKKSEAALAVFGQDGLDMLEELLSANLAIVRQETAPTPEEVAERDAIRFERLQRQFLDVHPDAAKYTEPMRAIIEEGNAKGNDPFYWQELAYYAAIGKGLDKEIESRVEEIKTTLRPVLEKEIHDKIRAGGLTHGSGAGQGTGAASEADAMSHFAIPAGKG